MSLIKTFRKTAIERRRLYVDYSRWLETTENLTNTQASVSPLTEEEPLVVDTAYTDATNKKLVMYVSGGVGNNNYVIQLVVTTDEGQVRRDDIGIKVAA